MGDVNTTAITGVLLRGYRRGTLSTDSWDQYVVPVYNRVTSFVGRASSFATPGRGATTQRLLALHNATGSSVIVNVNRFRVDVLTQAPKVITSLLPVIRIYRFTALPTNGATVSKVSLDVGGLSAGAVTAWGDASAEATLAGTALTITTTAGTAIEQAYPSRSVAANTTVGNATSYEWIDEIGYFDDDTDITLRALEGVCISIEQGAAAGSLSTDRYVGVIEWEEFQQP